MTQARPNGKPIFTRRWLRRILWLAPAISISFLLFLFLAFQHKPGWYKPARIDRNDADSLQAIRREATNRLDEFGRKLVEGRRFEITISDAAINNLLAVLPDVWPDAAERIPREIIEPAVAFENGEARVGAILDSRSWQFVAGARCAISVSSDSSVLLLTLDGVSGGSLPIPRSIILRALEKVKIHPPMTSVGRIQPVESTVGRVSTADEVGWAVPTEKEADGGVRKDFRTSGDLRTSQSRRAAPALHSSSGDAVQTELSHGNTTPLPQGGRGQGEGAMISRPNDPASITPLEDVTSPAQFFDGVSIRNEFTWPNGKRRFRIRAVTITDGQIRLWIEPL
ncbi:MAG: hypothetical protein HY287_17075 [Planctomycetes bacterium]|nr:hypothetical protein [Planctomycetota bacterium]